MIKINYLNEREYVIKREIETMVLMAPKDYGTQVLPVFKRLVFTTKQTLVPMLLL